MKYPKYLQLYQLRIALTTGLDICRVSHMQQVIYTNLFQQTKLKSHENQNL